MNNPWRLAWILWAAVGAGLEVAALTSPIKERNETLTVHTRPLRKTSFARFMAGGLFVWVAYHFTFEDRPRENALF